MVISNSYDMKMNFFSIEYRKVGKPTSTRKFTLVSPDTYYRILYDDVMDKITMSVYRAELLGFEMEELINVKRIIANQSMCEYQITLKDYNRTGKTVAEYEVEINCLTKKSDIDLTEV